MLIFITLSYLLQKKIEFFFKSLKICENRTRLNNYLQVNSSFVYLIK